ncbi:MAG TPA: tetratricopeptide repeat protein, partial [Bryobacteraceae bacterium]|nr:tetratricopeptide repeat protein [Bryobacteraceae bacterium]
NWSPPSDRCVWLPRRESAGYSAFESDPLLKWGFPREFRLDKAHRRELKHDKFVEQVGHSVEYAAENKGLVTKIGGAVLLVAVLALGWYLYSQSQHTARQQALREALKIQDAGVGAPANEFLASFPTQAEKDKAVQKAWSDLAAKYPGKPEGLIAKYYLGVTAADAGRLDEAEKHLREASESGNDDYASQAKLSLAQVYEARGKLDDAEKVLRSVIGDPTILVSKEQATLALGRMLSRTKPAEARKLLEPLRTERSAVSRAAITALSDIK